MRVLLSPLQPAGESLSRLDLAQATRGLFLHRIDERSEPSRLVPSLGHALEIRDTRPLDLGLRLGWLHEYASTARPITAAFAGAPSANFTVYGATPQRDAAVIGFQASTNVATATQLYLRYDGEIASGSDNHTLNVGLRLSW